MYLNQIYRSGTATTASKPPRSWYFGHPAQGRSPSPRPPSSPASSSVPTPTRPSGTRPPRSAGATSSSAGWPRRGFIDGAERAAAARDAALVRHPVVARGDGRPVLLRGGPPVPREGVRRVGALPQGLRVDTTLDPQLEACGGGGAPVGPPARRPARRASASPETSSPKGSTPQTYRDPSWDDPDAPHRRRRPASSSPRRRREPRSGSGRDGSPFPRRPFAGRGPRARPGSVRARGRDPDRVDEGRDGKPETFLSQEPQVEGAASSSRTPPARSGRSWAATTSTGPSSTARYRPLRQVGSAFKPFVYLTAIEAGFTPADTVLDAPITIVIDAAPGAVPAAELRAEVLRDRHVPVRARALDQRPGRPRGPPRRNAEGPRDRAPARHPAEPPRLSLARTSAPSR